MENNDVQTLLQTAVFRHFYNICQIPHQSGGEKRLSDYIKNWALELGLTAEQDEVCNVFIRKPATAGYEAAPVVMLQAHLDMVCEKAAGVEHDFSRDPIVWVVEGDTLSTGGKTTLGGDDGLGVALAMAILEASDLRHPELEVLFTVAEESDFTGAENFDMAKSRACYLINLDHVCDREVVCGSCGGMRVDFKMPLAPEAIPAGWAAYRLSVSGLSGGHSGEDIHRGRGNANVLLARLLLAAEDCCEFRLARIKGGTFRLAIPREAEAVICLDPAAEASLKDALSALERDMRAELTGSGGDLAVELTPAGRVEQGVAPATVLSALTLMPDGIFQMNELLTGLVDTSDNLGEVYLDDTELHIVLEIRSSRESLSTYLFQRMRRLAGLLGASCEYSCKYPSWEFRPESPLRKLCSQVYQQRYGQEPTFFTVHAGLEVGCFFQRKPQLDAVAIGADCRDFHSPSEAIGISSAHKVYEYLAHILSAIRQ